MIVTHLEKVPAFNYSRLFVLNEIIVPKKMVSNLRIIVYTIRYIVCTLILSVICFLLHSTMAHILLLCIHVEYSARLLYLSIWC